MKCKQWPCNWPIPHLRSHDRWLWTWIHVSVYVVLELVLRLFNDAASGSVLYDTKFGGKVNSDGEIEEQKAFGPATVRRH